MSAGFGGTGRAETFGRLLRAHRHRLGLSLAQLAALVHYDRGHISKIETDKRPPSLRFAQACDRVFDTGATFVSIAAALEPSARRRPGWARPAQLPLARRDFVGRERLLADLDDALLGGERSLAVPVVVVEGPSGVGKTELAVQWARRSVARGHFTDGQLYVDLGGADAELPPADLLADVLIALGVPRPGVPTGVDQRAAAFRSLLHDRKVLLVLDDAAHARQVHPFLPGSPGCAVLVTSRVRLPGLASRLGAVTLTVPDLTPAEAVRLVRSIIGDRCTDVDPEAIAELCGYQPLALVLAAEHVVTHGPGSTLPADLGSPGRRRSG
ncbi:helix-turn-helix domain-containing protein [Saccharothrix sp.]|uniref:helix-turn-helix domain-containing protein n=1 Tax=Saccharothrix sp. TaxID=1873460 RepID=UPI002811AAB8|nr:helix-turn-helix domain-containing protein [Saccharothrix sp.]